MNEHNGESVGLDFASVGDVTIDEFIQVSDLRVDSDPDEGDAGYKEMCFRFGDKIPYDDVVNVPAVGNASNAAVSAARLGLNSGYVTDIGNDRGGEECQDVWQSENVNTDYVTVHEEMQTNHHYVLRYGAERTILVKHQQYPYALPDINPAPRYMYLSSLAENSLDYHNQIADYLETHPETKLAFQPGTFQMSLGYDKLERLYRASELFFCNKEEAQRILETTEGEIQNLLKMMRERGPNIAVITDGPGGAFAFDGEEMWQMPMYPDPKPPVDRTGAGDAFSSTFTSALALGKSIPEALEWGPINSMSVVQYIGAREGLLSREKLEEHLANRPEDYVSTKIA